MFETMEYALKIFQSKLPEEKNEAISDGSLVIPETPSHCKNQFVLTEVLRKLGKVTKRSRRNDLWAALANSLNQEDRAALSSKDLLVSIQEIRGRVVAELLARHALFKDLINKDDHCPIFEDYIEDIKVDEVRERGIKEDHYILMAFAIAYKANVVVVRAEKSSLLYEPENPENNQLVWFLTFIPPHYYHATTADPNTIAEENADLTFLTDQIYQTDLLKEVNDRWGSEGYPEYRRRLESMLPEELPYQPSSGLKNVPAFEMDVEEDSVRYRVSRSKSDKKKVEHLGLMETV